MHSEINTLFLFPLMLFGPDGVSGGGAGAVPAVEAAKAEPTGEGGKPEADVVKMAEELETEGQDTAYSDAERLGCNLDLKWDATMDARTRPEHSALDGKLKDREHGGWWVENLGKYVSMPCHSGVAAFDLNCRCRMTAVVRPPEAKANTLGDGKKQWSGYNNWKEFLQRKTDNEDKKQYLSDERFDKLTIEARKAGAVVCRGTDEVETHLDSVHANASYVDSNMFFRKKVTLTEVLEETYHFEQDRKGLFSNVSNLKKRFLTREIDVNKYLISVSGKFKIPRSELDDIKKNLEYYANELEKLNGQK